MISLSIVKEHLKVCHHQEDQLIQRYTDAAYEWIAQTINKKIFYDQASYDTSILLEGAKQLNNAAIDSAVLMLVGHFFENREAVVVMPGSMAVTEVPMAVHPLIAPYRYWGPDDRAA